MYLESRDILKRFSLISRKQSKKILSAIRDGSDIEAFDLPDTVNSRDIQRLREKYQQKRYELDRITNKDSPRNIIFYHLVQDLIPHFLWSVRTNTDKRGRFDVVFECPSVMGLKPSLASLLLGLVSPNEMTQNPIRTRYPCLARLPGHAIELFCDLLQAENTVSPPASTMPDIVDWLLRGINGEILTIISPICPDYAAKHVGQGIYRYTFDGIGDGIGVVGRRVHENLPQITRFLKQLDVTYRIIVALGDFEAHSDELRKKLRLSENELYARFRKSQKCFAETCDEHVDAILFTDLVGGKDAWLNIHDTISNRLRSGDFGMSGLDDAGVTAIARSRRGLYSKWYGISDDAACRNLLIAQGAEYASMGDIVALKCENPLILGADHARMAPFFRFGSPLPVMHLKSNYIGIN